MADIGEVLTQLDEGLESFRESEGFLAWLETQARFHNYSFANTILIWLQRPTATRVAGFHKWHELKRSVRKGEKGIRILAPVRRKVESDDGDEEDEREVVYFRVVHVFDIEQTEGEDLPELPISALTGDDCGVFSRLLEVAHSEELFVELNDYDESKRTEAHGWLRPDLRKIWIRPELEPKQKAKTLAHELAHYFAEHKASGDESETVAEASAYIVMRHFDIDASGYTFAYLASWDADDHKLLRSKGAEIVRAARAIIDRVEKTGGVT